MICGIGNAAVLRVAFGDAVIVITSPGSKADLQRLLIENDFIVSI